jgi:hypothetical protein
MEATVSTVVIVTYIQQLAKVRVRQGKKQHAITDAYSGAIVLTVLGISLGKRCGNPNDARVKEISTM